MAKPNITSDAQQAADIDAIKTQPVPIQLTYEQLKELLTAAKPADDSGTAAIALQTLQDMKQMWDKTVPRANVQSTGLSPFFFKEECVYCQKTERHPETQDWPHPKPRLRYESYQCGIRLREDQLTVTEVELLNAFENNCEANKGQWTATIDRRGTTPRLLINFPATDIMQMDGIPPFVLLLKALLHGEKSIDPNNLYDEVRRMSALLAAQTAEIAALKASAA